MCALHVLTRATCLLFRVGAVLDPLPDVLRRAPLACTTCGAFINLYTTDLDHATGRWKCVFCGEHNSHPGELAGTHGGGGDEERK